MALEASFRASGFDSYLPFAPFVSESRDWFASFLQTTALAGMGLEACFRAGRFERSLPFAPVVSESRDFIAQFFQTAELAGMGQTASFRTTGFERSRPWTPNVAVHGTVVVACDLPALERKVLELRAVLPTPVFPVLTSDYEPQKARA